MQAPGFIEPGPEYLFLSLSPQTEHELKSQVDTGANILPTGSMTLDLLTSQNCISFRQQG